MTLKNQSDLDVSKITWMLLHLSAKLTVIILWKHIIANDPFHAVQLFYFAICYMVSKVLIAARKASLPAWVALLKWKQLTASFLSEPSG